MSVPFGSRPFIQASWLALTPARSDARKRLARLHRVAAERLGSARARRGPRAGAAPVPVPSAVAASASLGMLMVEPSTTFASGESPFAAARALVVRLLAAAMDQRVSPGWTVCATEALAGAAAAIAASAPSAPIRIDLKTASRDSISSLLRSRSGGFSPVLPNVRCYGHAREVAPRR